MLKDTIYVVEGENTIRAIFNEEAPSRKDLVADILEASFLFLVLYLFLLLI